VPTGSLDHDSSGGTSPRSIPSVHRALMPLVAVPAASKRQWTPCSPCDTRNTREHEGDTVLRCNWTWQLFWDVFDFPKYKLQDNKLS
jgi:hypothetical protein